MTRLSSCKIRYPVETRAQSGWAEAGSKLSFSVVQLEEANDLLRAESDTAARLRKNHTEMAKSMSQLESLNRELQERSRAIDGEKAQLEKEVLLIQSTLDSERRNYSQGSEEIRELQGEWRRAVQHKNFRFGDSRFGVEETSIFFQTLKRKYNLWNECGRRSAVEGY